MKKERPVKTIVRYDAGFDLIEQDVIVNNGVVKKCPRCSSINVTTNGATKFACRGCGKQWNKGGINDH